jgi:uncharacterized protein YbdZ (MbtH family)
MSSKKSPAKQLYKVVIGPGEAYSIWPADREGLVGYKEAGFVGTLKECRDYIGKLGKKPVEGGR